MLKFAFICYCIGVLLVKNSSCDFRSHPNWPKEAEQVCGESHSDRIIGGGFAALGQYPWMARLVFYDPINNDYSIYCGGSLVSDLFVISAAHCLFNEDILLDSVILGDYDDRTNPDCDGDFCAEPIQRIKATRVAHPTFDHRLIANDIMLVKLEKPAEFNGWVIPICLPTGSEKFKSSVEVAGWGDIFQLDVKPSPSPVLKFIKISMVDIAECEATFTTPLFRDTQICAGSSTVVDDSCRGDSGGPLMSVHSANRKYGPRYYLLGLVSFGPKVCGISPTIYTNVTAFMPFILKAMHTLTTSKKKKIKCKRKNKDKFIAKVIPTYSLEQHLKHM